MKRITTRDFIKKAIKIHNNKYDYSKVEYINSYTKIKIRCIKHNYIFEQLPNNHLQGQGCPKCANENNRLTVENFIKKAIKTHGDKYDYSKVIYINTLAKVKIKCIKHNYIFEQTPKHHLKGQGCPLCGKEAQLSSKEAFIKKAIKTHGDKYDYSKVNYKNALTKIKIRCIKHNYIFEQTPNKHLIGKGCPKCAGRNKTNKELIEQFRKIHGDKYDYSKVNYQGAKNNIIIICPYHGNFIITPNAHLNGRGCATCTKVFHRSKGEIEMCEYIKSIYSGEVLENTRKFIGKKELDIYLPELKLALEYNGEYWHELKERINPGCHEEKRKACERKGIKLIEISDNKWCENKFLIQKEIINIIENLITLKNGTKRTN